MKLLSSSYAQRCLVAFFCYSAGGGCGGPEKPDKTPKGSDEAVVHIATQGEPASSDAALERILTPAELPDESFNADEGEAVLVVLGKEYSARRYCGDGYNEPKIEVFAVKGAKDSVVYLCHSIEKRRTNQVSLFHASQDVKSTSLEPGGGAQRLSDVELEAAVAALRAEPQANDRTTPPSAADLKLACDALQAADPDHDSFELTTHTRKRPDGSSLLAATCSQKGRENVLVQVFDMESGQSFLAGGPSCTGVSSDGRYMACNSDSRYSDLIDVEKSLAHPKYRVRGSRLFSSYPSFHVDSGFYLDVTGCAAHARGPAAAAYAACLGMTDGSDMCEFTHWVNANTLEGRWALGGDGPSAGAGVRYNVDTKVYTFPNYSVRVPASSAAAVVAQAKEDGTYSPLAATFFTKAEAQELRKTLMSQGKIKTFNVVGRRPTKWVYGEEQEKGSNAYYEECCGVE